MTVRRTLIIVPFIVTLFLLQSYFWIPTYEEQTRGNPERLNEYISASSGDASILNPVLAADSASADINGLVFEGLLDRDEDLRLRGRLATSWDISEEAFIAWNEEAEVPGRGRLTPEEIIALLTAARQGNTQDQLLARTLANIKEMTVVPGREFTVAQSFKDKEKSKGKKEAAAEGDNAEPPVTVHVRMPARVKLLLGEVDQDLFPELEKLLGSAYFSSFSSAGFLRAESEVPPEKLARLAEELVPATEHNPVLLFHLRPDVQFHDGHAFTSVDVKFTFDAIMSPKNLSPRLSDYEPVKEVVPVDPLTVRVVYKRLYSPALGTWSMGILPEHLLNDEALAREAKERGTDPAAFSIRDSAFNRHPVGCGPFVFKEWKSDQQIILDRFVSYWEGPPHYQRYVYRIIPDLLTQEMEFYAGTIDSYSVQPHQVERLQNDPRFQSFSGLAFGYTYIGYNLRREPFQDQRVRLALGMAVDVDKIIRYVIHDQGEGISGPFVKQTDYYNPEVKPPPFDPEGALRILAEAGWHRNSSGWLEKDGKPLRFTLITNSGNDIRKAILTIAQDSWKKIGVDVRTDVLEWSVFIKERVNKLDFDALILGWSMGIEPDLYQIWHSSQANPFQLNFVGFNNPDADDLIVKIRQEYDYNRQVEYSQRLHEIIAREQPYTFLYVTKWTAILDRRIVIKDLAADGAPTYRKITPTRTGNYTYHFNRWIKLAEPPVFSPGQ